MFPCIAQPFDYQVPLHYCLLKTPKFMVLSAAAHTNPQMTFKWQEDYTCKRLSFFLNISIFHWMPSIGINAILID